MKKLTIKRRKQAPEAPTRITNETVAEHRERILAGGRKFKYPIQYARHKLVINAILVTLAAVLLLAVIGWWQLYPMQNASAFMYRLTRIIPVPVAVVNGEQVPYRDYLVQYRGSEYYLSKYGEVKLDSKDGRTQLDYIKRQSLDKAEQVAYARQIARSRSISVSEADVNSFIDQERNTANGRVSQETYDASIRMLYDESVSDYRLTVRNGILKNKVAFAIDQDASAQVTKATELLKSNNNDFAKTAESLASMKGGKVTAGQSGMIDTTSKYGGLRVSDVAKIKKGETSGALKSTTDDGYYFVTVVDKSDTQVNFSYLHIPLTTFADNFAKLKSDGEIKEYISVVEK
jgi:hypothetical protein